MKNDKIWFVAIDGQQSGPFSEEEIISRIKNGSIDDNYYVYRKGMTEWQLIESSEEYAVHFFHPPPPPHKKKIKKISPSVNESINAENKSIKKKGSFLGRLFFSLLLAVIGFFVVGYIKQSHIIPADLFRHIGSKELGLAGSFIGFVFGLFLYKPSQTLKRLSIFIGIIATIITIYFSLQTYREQYGPSSINIAGEWVASTGALHYNFSHTGGKNYVWTLYGTVESGNAWINTDNTITAVIKGNQFLFKVTRLQGNCAREIRDFQGGLVLNRISPCS